MPAANKTTNYDLNQWQGNEYPKRDDFNSDNLNLDEALTPTADPTATATSNGPHKLVKWVSVFAGLIKAITGKAYWYQTPSKSLEDLNTHLADTASQGVHNISTTGNLTYYVNGSTGNDLNDGLTADTAFKTIGKAISMLRQFQFINHTVSIRMAPGTYDEYISVDKFNGIGAISIYGDGGNVTLTGYVMTGTTNLASAIRITNSFVTVSMQNFVSKPSANLGGLSYAGAYVCESSLCSVSNLSINGNDVTTTGTKYGFVTVRANNAAVSGTFNNLTYVVYGESSPLIRCSSMTGSGNSNGLYAVYGTAIAKSGTMPSATTAEITNYGGVIR